MEAKSTYSSPFSSEGSSHTAEFMDILRHGLTLQNSVFSSSFFVNDPASSTWEADPSPLTQSQSSQNNFTDFYERPQTIKLHFKQDRRKKLNIQFEDEAKRSNESVAAKLTLSHHRYISNFFKQHVQEASGQRIPMYSCPFPEICCQSSSSDKNKKDATLCFLLEGKEWYYRSNFFKHLQQRRETAKNLDRVLQLTHPVTGRQKWGSNGVFILVCVCVAVANAGTGPMSAYISKQTTGASCLVLFFILAVLSALLTIPLIILELALGQVVQGSQVKVYDTLLPRAIGFGLAGCLMAVFQAVAESLFGATSILYLLNSLSRDLPWDETKEYAKVCEQPGLHNEESCKALNICMWSASKCVTDPLAKPLEFFLEMWQTNSDSGLSTRIVGANALIWIIIGTMLIMGVHAVANIAPFVAVLPNVWFVVVTFVVWHNNAGGHIASDYLYNVKYNDWKFLHNISLTSLVEMNAVSMKTLPSAGMGVLLTLASYNNLSGNVHVSAWTIFVCIWLLIFAAFHFLYGNAGVLMDAYGIKVVPEGTDMINWTIGKMRSIWMSNHSVPGYYVFSDPSFSTMPLTFASIPAKNVWCMLYYLWAVCALLMYLWAKTLPLVTVITDSHAMQDKTLKAENTILNLHIDNLEKMESSDLSREAVTIKNVYCRKTMLQESVVNKPAQLKGNEISEKETLKCCSTIKKPVGCLLLQSNYKENTIGKIWRCRLSRIAVIVAICVPIYLVSFMYCMPSSTNSAFEAAQYLVYIGNNITHCVYACFAVLAAWGEGMQEQMHRVGCLPVLFLAASWLFSGVLMGFLQIYEIKCSISIAVPCLIVGGTVIALFLCNKSTVNKPLRGVSFREQQGAMTLGYHRRGNVGSNTNKPSDMLQNFSLSDRVWWLFLGNIELLRVDINTAITGDAHKPVPFYWSILLKFWATPILVATATWRIVGFFIMTLSTFSHANSSGTDASSLIGSTAILSWTLASITVFVAILGFLVPRSLDIFLTKDRVIFPKFWVAAKKRWMFRFFDELLCPSRISRSIHKRNFLK